jgi:alkanesulfonate monooxygenase SsuD/methylene tetrahydromethanopterin reductase-like flavin-dependent oxidoreductase (luciferase family)
VAAERAKFDMVFLADGLTAARTAIPRRSRASSR